MNAYDIEVYHEKEKNNFIPYCLAYSIKEKIYHEYIDKDKEIIKKSIDSIFNAINKETIFYVHNINFDGMLIINDISKFTDISITSLIRNMNIYKIELTKKDKKIIFKCSYKILPESLEKISLIFKNEKKLSFPYDFSSEKNLNYIGEVPDVKYFKNSKEYENFKEKNRIFNFREKSIEYCIRDVSITKNFMKEIKKISKNYDINIDKIYSAPSLSFKIFEKKFNMSRLSFNIKQIWDDLIRTSYFGGRCEVYGNPTEKEFVQYYDFSGMYGQCMLEKFPYGKTYLEKNPQNINKPGFYYIMYNSDFDIPVLPHKNKLNGKLMFTNGKNEGLCWYEEILLFIEMGGELIDIKYAILFEQFDNIFSDFVETFEKIKEKDDIHKKFGKLIINSLYGRMGMNDIEDESLIINKEDFNEYNKKNKIKSFIELNNIVLINIEKRNINKVKKNIAIASCITSKARIKLYKAQQDVIKNKGRMLYSDTDSLYSAFKYDASNEKHGIIDWKKEKIKIKSAVFISPKSYAYIAEDLEVVKIKGFNNKSIKYREISEKFYNNEEFITIDDEFKLYKKDMILKKQTESKKLNLSYYDKRIFSKNKKNTYPLKKESDFKYIISHTIE